MAGSPRQRSSQSRRRQLLVRGMIGAADPQTAEAEASAPVELSDLLVPLERFLPAQESAAMGAIQRLLRGTEPVTWIFTGDNMAQGARFTGGARSFVEHFSERVRSELQRFLDIIVNTGISGDHAKNLRKTLKWRALRLQPDVVSVTLGINDAKAGTAGRESFQKHLRGVFEAIREAGAIPLVHTPNLIYTPAVENRADLPAYVEIIREEAERLELPLIDHWAHWQRIHATPESLLGWLGDGRIHPGQFGHRELAKLLFHEAAILDPASPTCNWEVP